MVELSVVMPTDGMQLQQPTVGEQWTSFVVVVASSDECQPELEGRKSEIIRPIAVLP